MGASTQLLAAAVSSGMLGTSLLRAIRAWLESRSGRRVKIEFRSEDGHTIEIDLDEPDQAERYIREILSRDAARKPESKG